MNIEIIDGPPGTGKTTHLLGQVDELLQSGIEPGQILFLSFTRKAAYEARDRAMAKFDLPQDAFPWFRTLHSLAFSRLNLPSGSLMTFKDYRQMGSAIGVGFTYYNPLDDGQLPQITKGDKLLFIEQIARASDRDVHEVWEQYGTGLQFTEVEQFEGALKQYKATEDKLDFTDLLEKFVADGCSMPYFSHMFLDEAQDLSKLQWRMAQGLFKQAERAWVAGDDDQAIFSWAGADVNSFIELQGKRTTLPVSHRLPRKVFELAEKVSGQITNRIVKKWEPRDEEGMVERMGTGSVLDLSKGTWLMLARNNCFLDMFRQYCLKKGVLFHDKNGKVHLGDEVKAIHVWNQLRSGLEIHMKHVKGLTTMMQTGGPIRRGFKKRVREAPDNLMVTLDILIKKYGFKTREPWTEVLTGIAPLARGYLDSVLRTGGEDVQNYLEGGNARVRLTTIHSVKGGEADFVLLCPDMAGMTYREYRSNPEPEHRVWYVAVTRARHALYIMPQRAQAAYKL